MITDLQNPERDLALLNREGPEEKPARKRGDPPEIQSLRQEAEGLRKELQGFRARVEAARKTKPQGSELHCKRCFDAGRDAALAVMEGARKG